MKTLRLFAMSLVSAGLLAGGLSAEEGKPQVGQDPTAGAVSPHDFSKKAGTDAPKVPTSSVKEAVARETSPGATSKLDGMMQQLGVNFEKKVDEKTKVTYYVVKEYGPDNYFFEVEESKNKNYTWITFPCGKAPETGIPSEVMERMLSENTKMATAFFQYYPKSRMIVLKMPLSTAALDAKLLKAEINWMLKDAGRTRHLWDSTQWGSATAGK